MDDVFAVVTDLFFVSRIHSAASAVGVSVRFVGPDGSIPESAPRLTLVDLDADVDVPGTIQRLKAAGAVSIVAFGPHLDTESRKVARSAGADRVLAKSKFVNELPNILATFATPERA
jgi:hypothetical protein